jgi:hypothetical protein
MTAKLKFKKLSGNPAFEMAMELLLDIVERLWKAAKERNDQKRQQQETRAC